MTNPTATTVSGDLLPDRRVAQRYWNSSLHWRRVSKLSKRSVEGIIRANHDGAKKGDQTATGNAVKAIQEQNKMLGVRDGTNNTFTINTADETGKGINWDLRAINFVKPPPTPESEDGPVPGHSTPYSASIHKLRLIEGPANDPEPIEEPKPAVRRYEEAAPDPQGDAYARSFAAREPGANEPKTEFELPVAERFGFSTDDQKSVFGTSKKRKTQ